MDVSKMGFKSKKGEFLVGLKLKEISKLNSRKSI